MFIWTADIHIMWNVPSSFCDTYFSGFFAKRSRTYAVWKSKATAGSGWKADRAWKGKSTVSNVRHGCENTCHVNMVPFPRASGHRCKIWWAWRGISGPETPYRRESETGLRRLRRAPTVEMERKSCQRINRLWWAWICSCTQTDGSYGHLHQEQGLDTLSLYRGALRTWKCNV